MTLLPPALICSPASSLRTALCMRLWYASLSRGGNATACFGAADPPLAATMPSSGRDGCSASPTATNQLSGSQLDTASRQDFGTCAHSAERLAAKIVSRSARSRKVGLN